MSTSTTPAKRRWWTTPSSKESIFFYLCVSPFILGFIVFTAGPMITSVVLSLTDWDFLSPAAFTGLGLVHRQLAVFADARGR